MSTAPGWRRTRVVKQLRAYANSPWLPHVLAVLSFALITVYYMTPQALHCQTTVYGFGDNTGGPIWRYTVRPDNPLWGPESATNYPYGEDLSSPVNYIAVLQYTLFWLLAKIAGPICGYNLMNAFGFVATAAAMYGFIYWLTRKKSIAWLAGFAVSFSPYFQNQVGSHPSYGYAAFLILAMWLYLRLLRERRWIDAPLLAVVVAACVYWDPYFALFIATILAPLVAVTLVYSYLQVARQGSFLLTLNALWQRMLPFALVGVFTFILILPLIGIAHLYAARINAQVGAVRDQDPVNAITVYCTNKPSDYLLPSDTNYFADWITNERYPAAIQRLKHGCNPAEYNVGLSLTLVTVLVVGGVIFVRNSIRKRRLHRGLFAISQSGLGKSWITLSVIGVLGAGVLLGLPAVLTTRHFPSPTYFLLQVTQAWRTFSREYVVVNIAVVTLAAISLYFLAQTLKDRSKLKYGAFVLLFLGIFVEYQAFTPFSGSRTTFSYDTDAPSIYQWVRSQSDIQHVAVYPIIQIGQGGDPLLNAITMQTIHHKQLLNSVVGNSPQDALHLSLRDLSAPETLPTLRGLGIDTLEIHGVGEQELTAIPGIEIMRFESVPNSRFGSWGSMIAIAKILPGPAQDFALTLESGFQGQDFTSVTGVGYTTINNSQMKLTPLNYNAQSNALHMTCFEVATAAASGADDLTVLVDGTPAIAALPINGQYARVSFPARENQSILLRNRTGQDMRVRNLGCPTS
jgi:hypothetical protein